MAQTTATARAPARTVLITGASKGIGAATARLFQARGWNTIATMRAPEQQPQPKEAFHEAENVLVTRLDVLDRASIQESIALGIRKFGQIDAVVNNAGYRAYGVLEAARDETIRRQFDTNIMGVLEVTRALIPHFREKRAGVIINVSSIGGKLTFPLGALYHGTKFAVEGFSEALHHEMAELGVQVKIVEPGATDTEFAKSSYEFFNDEALAVYQPFVQRVRQAMDAFAATSVPPDGVARVIYTAATDGTSRLRYTAGADARELMDKRKELDDDAFGHYFKQKIGLEPR